MINKKAEAGDQIMIFAFLLILFIIGGGIAFGVSLFFTSDYDTRQVDADLLNYKIKSCLSDNDIDFSNPKNFYTTCNINKNITQEFFLILIKQNQKEVFNYHGDETQCSLSEKNPNYPKCTNSTLIKNNNEYYIMTGSNQHSRRLIS